jgi:hypothetical protein
MNRKRWIALSMLFVVATGVLFTMQVGPKALGFGTEADSRVAISEIEEHPQEYVGEQFTIEGWYQGGLVRDADPQCATTREGIQAEEYSSVFIDAPKNRTLYTGVKYRYTGTLYAEIPGRSAPNDEPIFVPSDIERFEENPDSCTPFGNATSLE